jgi:hypothetical protein
LSGEQKAKSKKQKAIEADGPKRMDRGGFCPAQDSPDLLIYFL